MVTAVGLDLSLTASGVAVGRRHGDTDEERSGVYMLHRIGTPGVTNLCVAEQMGAIRGLANLIEQKVDLRARDVPATIVIEALENGYTYGGATERTVLWWQVVERFAGTGVWVYMPTSAQLKIYATGNGRAKKPEVIAAVKEHWPWWQVGKDDNLADAATAAEMAWALTGEPSVALPKEHTRVLERVRSIVDPPARVASGKTAITRKATKR